MKLQEGLPTSVMVGRRWYKLDLDFRNVLRMMDVLRDEGLTPEAQEYLAARCVTKHPGRGVLDAVKTLLFGQETQEQTHKRVTSFEQDAGLIRAAFWQAYGIDLYTARLHWLQFMELLQGLPEDTQYMNIVSIRARPMPPPTKYNREEREWLRKAKAHHAIRITDKEAESDYNRNVADVFHGLMGMIPKG